MDDNRTDFWGGLQKLAKNAATDVCNLFQFSFEHFMVQSNRFLMGLVWRTQIHRQQHIFGILIGHSEAIYLHRRWTCTPHIFEVTFVSFEEPIEFYRIVLFLFPKPKIILDCVNLKNLVQWLNKTNKEHRDFDFRLLYECAKDREGACKKQAALLIHIIIITFFVVFAF